MKMCREAALARLLLVGALATAVIVGGFQLVFAQDKTYVGSEACLDCHEDQYENYRNYSKKAHSYESVRVMRKGLTEEEYLECLKCHATGYGQARGFVSIAKTPELQNLGCESCHGPGSDHIDSEDPDDIVGELSATDCERCHNAERIANFKFKPLLLGGAH